MITRPMRRVCLQLPLLLALAACASRPRATTSAPVERPPVETLMHGYWAGIAPRTPLGVQPYALFFRKEGGATVAETPESLGEQVLPPGAYQKFTFRGETLEFHTAMGSKGMLDGSLALAPESGPTKRVYCDGGGCGKMKLEWESAGAETLLFRTFLDGKLHVEIRLEFEGDQ